MLEIFIVHATDKDAPFVRGKLSIAPSASLLLRTPTPPSGRLATSTQLPWKKLSELFHPGKIRNRSS
jgi:hypothetical protein